MLMAKTWQEMMTRPSAWSARSVLREGHRHQPARHGEHRRDGDGVPDGHQQGRCGTCSSSQRGFDISDEAPCRRLRPGELGHRKSQERDGHGSGEDRQRRGDTGGYGDHSEPEVEVNPRPDVRDRRGRHVTDTELAGLEVVSALAHHVSPRPATAYHLNCGAGGHIRDAVTWRSQAVARSGCRCCRSRLGQCSGANRAVKCRSCRGWDTMRMPGSWAARLATRVTTSIT